MATKENIFDKAKKVAPKKEEKHEIVNIPELEKDLIKISSIDEEMAELAAKRAILDSRIRESAKVSMIGLYNKTKKFPGTIKIVSGTMSFQFITSDKYKKIDEDGFNNLSEMYGENIVEEDTTYIFNPTILLKHKDHISGLLMGSKKLSDEDKENLLISETSYSVKKGIIKDLFNFVKDKVDLIIEDIQPIFSIKSIQKS